MAFYRCESSGGTNYTEVTVEVGGSPGWHEYTVSELQEIVGVKAISVKSPWNTCTGYPEVRVEFTGNVLRYLNSGKPDDQTTSLQGTIVVFGK